MNQRFLVLDSFRGIAAICVVIFHMHIIGSITELNFFRGSSLFVEFFFVLSGFVLAHTYGFKDISFKRFIISRTFRLYPLHLFMFIMFFLLQIVQLIFVKYGMVFNKVPFEGHYAFKEIIPNLLFMQSWLPGFLPTSWNQPAWSLSVEYYMYIIFFFTLFIKSNLKYIVWFLFSFISFYMIINSFGIMSEVIRGLSCFFAGALTYLIYRKINLKFEKINAKLFSIVEFLLIFLIIYIISYVEEYKAIYASFIFLVIVFFFAFEKGVLSKILKASFFQLLGKLSYSIYMTHVLIIFCFKAFIQILDKVLQKNYTVLVDNSVHIDFGNIFINNFVVFIILFIVVLISMFTYKYIEVKGQEFGKRFLK
ncbi:acyltransferase [Arcobacter cryaerophilus gv. occultus]|uniref:acyltransferase family protein n=1 Tax=Aliarcobacter cryaerophilus TaxID=28198 RepID=UPI000D015E7A|nr:acyltransferase [Aliarcobacter cryaerophilus]PRM91596.1 acyltransferase [Arcobacter cryaerophilus gv. occultus]